MNRIDQGKVTQVQQRQSLPLVHSYRLSARLEAMAREKGEAFAKTLEPIFVPIRAIIAPFCTLATLLTKLQGGELSVQELSPDAS